MRTFRKMRQFGSSGTGATGGKSNEALLVQNPTATTQTVTLQCLAPDGSITYVGPLNIPTNSLVVYPFFTYGFTGSTAGLKAYELF
jgi:hypothetical protein